jgi:anti-sigma factor RsiW
MMITETTAVDDQDLGMDKACEEMALELSAYFDGELTPAEHGRIESHLNGCESCNNALEDMGRLRSAFQALESPERSLRKPIFKEILAKLNESP